MFSRSAGRGGGAGREVSHTPSEEPGLPAENGGVVAARPGAAADVMEEGGFVEGRRNHYVTCV